MPWRLLAFAAGVWLLQQVAVLPAPSLLAGFGFAGLGLLAWRRRAAGLLGAALLGCAWAGAWGHWRLADALPADWEGRDIELTGIVADLPQRFERGVRFVFVPEAVAAPVPSRLVLAWYRHFAEESDEAGDEEAAPAGALPMPRAGERWRFVVRLKRPHGNLNPHGFDYEGWLFERGLRATGYVRKATQTRRLDAAGASMPGWREAARARIARALPEHPYGGILAALAVGDQQAIRADQWQLFAATGITHLMSISGLHVTMLGGLLAWLTAALWRRHPGLPLRWPALKAAAVAGFSGAFAYAWFAGFGIPAQRTLYMLGVVLLALLSGRRIAVPTILGAALLLVLLLDPWAVLAAGFWLSFGAVGILLFASSGRLGHGNWLTEWWRAQWAVTLGMIPLLLALFQQFSLVSPLANAIAIPLVSLLVTPLALLGCLPGCAWALELAHAVLAPLMAGLNWLATLPGALLYPPAPPPWAVVLALTGAFWCLVPRGIPGRWLGAILLSPLFLLPPERPAAGELRMAVLDVGQGQAVHVQTATHDLLFDAGPAFGTQADAGSRIIVPYLRAAGVSRLDGLILSHVDKDHVGGAEATRAGVTVVEEKSALAGRPCRENDAWQWDGVRFYVLHPPAADYALKKPSNALSCVLLIETPHGRVLIPGDIEGRAEAELLARHGDRLRAEVLIAPHHGGKRTASPEFVAAVGARAVIFPVGYRNRFAHPYPEVLARFAAAEIHRTDRHGAVLVRLEAGGLGIEHERARRRRYWQNIDFPSDG